jgi:hypothetical protein
LLQTDRIINDCNHSSTFGSASYKTVLEKKARDFDELIKIYLEEKQRGRLALLYFKMEEISHGHAISTVVAEAQLLLTEGVSFDDVKGLVNCDWDSVALAAVVSSSGNLPTWTDIVYLIDDMKKKMLRNECYDLPFFRRDGRGIKIQNVEGVETAEYKTDIN